MPVPNPETSIELLERCLSLESDRHRTLASLGKLACHVSGAPFARLVIGDEPGSWFEPGASADAAAAHPPNPAVLHPIVELPLRNGRGTTLGALTILDFTAHDLSANQAEALRLIADNVVVQLEAGNTLSDLMNAKRREIDLERRIGSERMEEAQRLAAELHDGVGQDLFGISMILAAIGRTSALRTADMVATLKEVSGLIGKAIENCRRVAEGYGGFILRKEGLEGALHRCMVGLDKPSIRYEFVGQAIPLECLDEAEAYYLFAIAREAMTRASREPGCTKIRVCSEHSAGVISLAVEDDAPESHGVPTHPDDELSAAIMEHRARRIGAGLRWLRTPGGERRLECTLPCGFHRWGHSTACPILATG